MVNKNVCVVQARLGSKRLPGKVLMELCDKPMLVHIVERLKSVDRIDRIIVATGGIVLNDPIREACAKYQIECYSGDEDDVLDRVYRAVQPMKPRNILRVTADCPLIDPTIVTELIEYFEANHLDHCGVATGAGVSSQSNIKKFPDGLDCEIMSFKSLETAWINAIKKEEREHVTPYIWKRPSMFKIGALYAKKDLSDYRLTVDNAEDFELINWIYTELYPKYGLFTLDKVIQQLDNYPKFKKINRKFLGQEGYENI